MREDICYKMSQDGGFIIRFREAYNDYELIEIPIYGGQEQHVGFFLSIESAKMYADKLT